MTLRQSAQVCVISPPGDWCLPPAGKTPSPPSPRSSVCFECFRADRFQRVRRKFPHLETQYLGNCRAHFKRQSDNFADMSRHLSHGEENSPRSPRHPRALRALYFQTSVPSCDPPITRPRQTWTPHSNSCAKKGTCFKTMHRDF